MAGHGHHHRHRYDRDGQEREQGGNGSYNERNEGWEDKRGGGGGHQQSLLRPNYLGSGSNDNTSFSPGRPALMASPGAMKVMGGAGITENLDRPNMPVRQPVQERLVERSSRPSKRGGDREESSREERRKKRKSRWTDEACKTFIPGLPTMIPGGLSKEQEEAYLCKFTHDALL